MTVRVGLWSADGNRLVTMLGDRPVDVRRVLSPTHVARAMIPVNNDYGSFEAESCSCIAR